MSGKNNNKQLPTDTSHFQTIDHPVHITLEVAIEPAQITPQSTPYESRTLTITVNKRKKQPTPAPVKYDQEPVIKLIDDLDVPAWKKKQVKARTTTLFNMTHSTDLSVSLTKTGQIIHQIKNRKNSK